MGFTVVQKHDKGVSKWRISNKQLETCFCDENVIENKWSQVDELILDPHAIYSLEPEMKNKNDRN